MCANDVRKAHEVSSISDIRSRCGDLCWIFARLGLGGHSLVSALACHRPPTDWLGNTARRAALGSATVSTMQFLAFREPKE